MDLHIFWSSDAERFTPTKPTYAIRIFRSLAPGEAPKERPPLKESPLYIWTNEYVFDDNEAPGSHIQMGPQSITPEIAESIVSNFAQVRSRVEALLVHCSRGVNRSPSVAIALNWIFKLGHDDALLKGQYPHGNKFVCKLILEAGKRHLS